MKPTIGIVSRSGIGDFIARTYAFESIEEKFGGHVNWHFFIKNLDSIISNRTVYLTNFIKQIPWENTKVTLYNASLSMADVFRNAASMCDFVFDPFVNNVIYNPNWIYYKYYQKIFKKGRNMYDCICHLYTNCERSGLRNLSLKSRNKIVEILKKRFSKIIILSWDINEKYDHPILYNLSIKNVIDNYALKSDISAYYIGVDSWVNTAMIDTHHAFIWGENDSQNHLFETSQLYFINPKNNRTKIKLNYRSKDCELTEEEIIENLKEFIDYV